MEVLELVTMTEQSKINKHSSHPAVFVEVSIYNCWYNLEQNGTTLHVHRPTRKLAKDLSNS